MNASETRVTRGYGVLEGFLAKKRARVTDRLIPSERRAGRILDIGCGMYPLFLLNTRFNLKFGIDKIVESDYGKEVQDESISFVNYDIEEGKIPFNDEYFDVVTMLAIFEHIAPEKLPAVLGEVGRILKPGGMYVMTTPAVWTAGLLRFMAKLRLVSPVEIEEHKGAYSRAKVFSLLEQANFAREKARSGYFEMFLNTWTVAIK
jgi:ubiquinone/menaquinone biosynthesis C-methylase UbiE